jgi:hypothetical protein
MRHLVLVVLLGLCTTPAYAQDIMLRHNSIDKQAATALLSEKEALPAEDSKNALMPLQEPDQQQPEGDKMPPLDEGSKAEATPVEEKSPGLGVMRPADNVGTLGQQRRSGLGARSVAECEEGFARNEKGDCERVAPSPTHGGFAPVPEAAPAPEPEPEVAEPPCPEGTVRLSTGGECTALGPDGASPHDAVPVVVDSEGSVARCPDFHAARRTEHGFACEPPGIDCPEGQQARPTAAGWRCESPTVDCITGQVPRALPNGWECVGEADAAAVPDPTPAPAAATDEPCPPQFRRDAAGVCQPPAPCPEGQARNRAHECVPFDEIR